MVSLVLSDDPSFLESEGSDLSRPLAATLPRSLGIHSLTPIRRRHDDRESPFHLFCSRISHTTLVCLACYPPQSGSCFAASFRGTRLQVFNWIGSTLVSLILLIDLKLALTYHRLALPLWSSQPYENLRVETKCCTFVLVWIGYLPTCNCGESGGLFNIRPCYKSKSVTFLLSLPPLPRKKMTSR